MHTDALITTMVLLVFVFSSIGGCSEDPADQPAGRSEGARSESASSAAPRFDPSAEGIALRLYRERHQGAFSMLIPKGWKDEGGMVPSGVGWNLVDLVENNIMFRVTSPDKKSFFGWYPRFYFQDPAAIARSSMGVMNPSQGEVLNGCWLYPYMSLEQYVKTIVFGQFAAAEFKNPRLVGRAQRAPELKPFLPRVATRSECGYVNFECTIDRTPCYGRIYAILYDLGGAIWSTVGTFGLVAPKSRWPEDERLMEMCIRTFRLDPTWARRASAAASKRAGEYNDVLRDMHRIDAEIQQNRAQTNSDINAEFYKVLTDQIETRDPTTGEEKWLPMYDHAWTDGKGNYFLSDGDAQTLPFEDASDWRPLQVVNRNDPAYRSR